MQIHRLPDSKVHGANIGPIWGRQDPGGPHVDRMIFAIWAVVKTERKNSPDSTECKVDKFRERHYEGIYRVDFWGKNDRKANQHLCRRIKMDTLVCSFQDGMYYPSRLDCAYIY